MKQSLKEYIPFIIISVVSLVLIGLGVYAMTGNEPEPVDPKKAEDYLIREDSNTFGNSESNVVLVDFSDFQCGFCAQFAPVQKRLREEYSDKVLFVSRHFSLNLLGQGKFPNGLVASDAAEAAAAQGKFWEMHDVLFEKQDQWSRLSKSEAKEKFTAYAEEIGVEDMEKFTKDFEQQEYRAKIERDFDDGEVLGVTGTPAVFLNGARVTDWNYDALSSQIDDLLLSQQDQPLGQEATE